MKIAFIHAPFSHKKFAENLSVVDDEFCVAPPIVLSYVAAIAERSGHEAKILDCRVLKLTQKEAAAELAKWKPDLMGFRFDTYNFHETLGWAQGLKRVLGVPVLAGGINFSLYPKEAMNYPTIDFALAGEVIYSLPKFLEAFGTGGSYKNVPGLWYRENGQLKHNRVERKLAGFDEYPFPARHLLPNSLYSSYLTQKKPYTIMLTTTGCPFDCTFCAIAPLPYRARSAKSVLAEIEECVKKFGIGEIDFFDATFFANRKRDLAIFREIQKRRWKIEWACRTRVDVIDEKIMREAARAGCRRIYVGIESPSEEILRAINKRITPDKVRRAVEIAHKYGVRVMGFFMIGNPGETEEMVWKSVEFAKDLDLDFVQFMRTIAKPGSGLAGDLKKHSGKDYWSEFVAGGRKEERWPTPWTSMSQSKMEKLTKLAYYSFYFRPEYVIRTLRRARSASEVARYFRVGMKMAFHYLRKDR